MEQLGTPPKLMDEWMGHEDGSVQARYSHVMPAMRTRLLDDLTELWEGALDERRALASRSPVAVLDRLLTARGGGPESESPRSSPEILQKQPGERDQGHPPVMEDRP
jgi:hypothetical protein